MKEFVEYLYWSIVAKLVNSFWLLVDTSFMSFYKSSNPELFCKKVVVKNFASFIGKTIIMEFFLGKVAIFDLQLYWKRAP